MQLNSACFKLSQPGSVASLRRSTTRTTCHIYPFRPPCQRIEAALTCSLRVAKLSPPTPAPSRRLGSHTPVMVAVQLERRIIAPSLEVWRALSTPRGLALWQADQVRGQLELGHQVELAWPALGASLELGVEELEPGRRIVLADDDTRLELELITGGVRLTHHALADGAHALGMESSWRLALSQLAHSLERHPLCRRVCHWAALPMRASPETVYSMATEPTLAARWLWSGTVGQEGTRARLRVGELPLSGRVLCHVVGRDLSLVWEEQGASTLTLRTLPSPLSDSERVVALVWSCWEPPDAAPEQGNERALKAQPRLPIVAELDLALERLSHLLQAAGQA